MFGRGRAENKTPRDCRGEDRRDGRHAALWAAFGAGLYRTGCRGLQVKDFPLSGKLADRISQPCSLVSLSRAELATRAE